VNRKKIGVILTAKAPLPHPVTGDSWLQAIQKEFDVLFLDSKTKPSDPEFLKKIEAEHPVLVLAPLGPYLKWIHQLGFEKTAVKTASFWVGYTSEPLDLHPLDDTPPLSDLKIIDFSQITGTEALRLIKTLAIPSLRAGLGPLLGSPQTPIYCENWIHATGLGFRLDQILALPEVAETRWMARAHCIRILLLALWSLFEEENPRKAYFQIGADSEILAFRLYYSLSPSSFANPPDRLLQFSPLSQKHSTQSLPRQTLLKFSNFLRVHEIPEKYEFEVTVGLLNSVTQGSSQDRTHFVWTHPRATLPSTEQPYEIPNPHSPQLKVLPPISLPTLRLKNIHSPRNQQETLASVIQAFQERYFDAKYQIRQFEIQLLEMEKKGTSAPEMKELRLKMEALANREISWMKQMSQVLHSKKKSQKRK
jgi:hypothetical protein